MMHERAIFSAWGGPSMTVSSKSAARRKGLLRHVLARHAHDLESRLIAQARPCAGRTLLVSVDDQDLAALALKCSGDVDGKSGLPDAAFLIEERDDHANSIAPYARTPKTSFTLIHKPTFQGC
jgi:hypothetical protein